MLTASKGVSYLWSNGATDEYINVSEAGKYYVTVTDVNGCVGTSNTIEVLVSKKLTPPKIIASEPLQFCSSGSVTMTVPDIIGTSYYWKKDGVVVFRGPNTYTATKAGTYTVELSNFCGYIKSSNAITIRIDEPVAAFAIDVDGPVTFCPGEQATLHVPAVPYATYTWKKDGVVFGGKQQTQVVTEAGTYMAEITNLCGPFTSSNVVKVTVLPAPVKPVAVGAEGCSNESLTLTASGGTDGAYRWYTTAKGGAAISGFENGKLITPVLKSTTTYFVATTNGKCESERTMVAATIHTAPAAPQIIAQGALQTCNGGNVVLTRTSVAGVHYQWLKDGVPVGAGEENFAAKESGTYAVQASNTCGVTASSNTLKVSILAPLAPPVVQDGSACGAANIVLTAQGAEAGNYRWYDQPSGGSPIAKATGSTYVTPVLEHSRTYYVAVVKQGCESERIPVQAIVEPVPVADAGTRVLIDAGQSIALQGSGGGTYLWTPATGLDNPTLQNPAANPTETTTYTLTVTNEQGCQDTAQVVVQVRKPLSIPNAFSPNGDGVNDTWVIENIAEFKGVQIEIFNRWGNRIFESMSYQNEWDGIYRGKPLPVSTYFYVLTMPDKKQLAGHVDIIQ